jgi:hypothetical protein
MSQLPTLPSSSPLPSQDPITSRALHLKNFLHSKAIELQDRDNRHNSAFINSLLKDLQNIKFECLNSDTEICNLFASISKKVEICEQQLQIESNPGTNEDFVSSRRKRRRRKLRESFGFSQFKDQDCSEDDEGFHSSEDEEPEYLRHFQMEKRKNEEELWGQKQVESDGLEGRREFRDIKYTVLEQDEQFGDRIKIVKE